MTPGSTDVLRVAVDTVRPLLGLFALHLLLVGHDEPGGGFAAGLLASGALAIDAIAHRGDGVGRLLLRLPATGTLVGAGLVVCATVAVAPLLAGQPLLTASSVTLGLGLLGTAKLSTVLAFDVGVSLIVVGLASAVLDHIAGMRS